MQKFPKDFYWGAASSAPQFEGIEAQGQPVETVWTKWHQEAPERFFNQIGPRHGHDFNDRYQEDIDAMVNLGFNSYRTSISWARLFPFDQTPNQEAVEFYKKVFKTMRQKGIEPIVNLYHFDMPCRFYALGGWESKVTVRAFERYAAFCFETFKAEVKEWVTFNEPIVPIEMGYLNTHHLPEVNDLSRALIAGLNTLMAHKRAVRAFKKGGYGGRIGIVLNLTPSYPRSQSGADLRAAAIADAFFNRSFLDPVVLCRFPQICLDQLSAFGYHLNLSSSERYLLSNYPVDFLGVNYYQPRRVKEGLGDNPLDFAHYHWPEAIMNPYRGWEIYEKGLYDIAKRIQSEYGNIPWYVAENGIGVSDEERFMVDGEVKDDYRIDFMKGHLAYLHQAIEEGSACFGYHVWTFVDNWSWLNAYKNRYGLYRKDLETFNRHIKKSGRWFQTLTRNNGF